MAQFEWVHAAWLALAIVLEIVANVFLKFSDGFRRKIFGLLSLAAVLAAFSALSQAVKGIDLSVAYALWGGFGIAATLAAGWILFGQRLNRKGWIVPPAAAPWDFGLIVLRNPPSGITPLPLFEGDKAALTAALKAAGRKVTQAGYPEDHLDTLYSHQNCEVTGWAQTSVMSHQCDTLPGDSGSPLMLHTDDGWQLIGVQSSAPAAKDRWRADNRAISVTGFRDKLDQLSQK